MPWTIPSTLPQFVSDPSSCAECHGDPPDSGNGSGQCPTCRAILISTDPEPGSVSILTLIPVDENLRPLPRRHRRSIEIRWGERTQADGTMAKVYRAVNKQTDRYVEKIVRSDGAVYLQDEPLSDHRGHGSARRARES